MNISFQTRLIIFSATWNLMKNKLLASKEVLRLLDVFVITVRNVVFIRVCHTVHSGGVWQTPPLGRHPTGRHPPPPSDDHCSEWYASYWNAFLLIVHLIPRMNDSFCVGAQCSDLRSQTYSLNPTFTFGTHIRTNTRFRFSRKSSIHFQRIYFLTIVVCWPRLKHY